MGGGGGITRTVHFINLSNGMACFDKVREPHFVRLQSTACEQHRWRAILRELGADLYMALALGDDIIFHDKSERKPYTRAWYQGMVWIKFVLDRRWWGRYSDAYVKGTKCTEYFAYQYKRLNDGDKHIVDYFRRHVVCDKWSVQYCSDVKGAHIEPATYEVALP